MQWMFGGCARSRLKDVVVVVVVIRVVGVVVTFESARGGALS